MWRCPDAARDDSAAGTARPAVPFARLTRCRLSSCCCWARQATAISLYSAGYFRASEGTAPGLICFQYHVFLAAMALVLVADDAYVFMVAWESMALASFFLVTTEHRIPEIRRAGLPLPADRAHRCHRDPALLRHVAGWQRRLHVHGDARDASDGRVAKRRVLPRRSAVSARRRDCCRCISGCRKRTLRRLPRFLR